MGRSGAMQGAAHAAIRRASLARDLSVLLDPTRESEKLALDLAEDSPTFRFKLERDLAKVGI